MSMTASAASAAIRSPNSPALSSNSPIDGYAIDLSPLRGRDVGFTLAAAERHYLVPRPNETRNQLATDVAGGADHDDPAHRASLATMARLVLHWLPAASLQEPSTRERSSTTLDHDKAA
jgi:hypothetical protein